MVILGSRGLPARYGGFETLASVLAHRLKETTSSVQIPSTSTLGFRANKTFIGSRLETIVGTYTSARKIGSSKSVLVLNPINVVSALLLSRRDHLVVIHMDGRDDRRRKWPWLLRQIYRGCQRLCIWADITLVFDSRVVRDEIGGSDAEKHALIAYGGCEACESRRKSWRSVGQGKRFVTLARAEPENQLVEIARAVAAMTAPGQLRVVTTTRYRGKYWQRLVDEVKWSSTAEIVDGIWDHVELCSMYREVSAVIHGHTVGGTNPSLVLALCHGTPVLAHDNPYNREVAGSLARYWKDEQELTKLLDDFDPATWPYDQAAVDDFNRRYNWDDVVEKYKRVLGLDQSSSGGQSNGQ